MFIKKLLILLLIIPIVFANEISIDNCNWSIGENRIKINFTYVPETITFTYPENFIYKSLNNIDNYTYEALFDLKNTTESGNYSLIIKTEKSENSFSIEFTKPIINNTVNETINQIEEEKKYIFDFDKTEFIMIIAIGIIMVLIITIVVWNADKNRKMAKR